MKHTRSTVLLFSLPLLLAPPAFLGCGAKVTPSIVTETGNPPLLEEGRIISEGLNGRISVKGQPGATSPGAEITVTNETTDLSVTVTADEDGAFTVEIAGDPIDELKITAKLDGQTQSIEVSIDAQAADAGSDGPAPSASGSMLPQACNDYQADATSALAALRSETTRQCTTSTDCQVVRPPSCAAACATEAISTSSVAAYEAGVASIQALSCDPFEAKLCMTDTEILCQDVGSNPTAACVDSQCQMVTGFSEQDCQDKGHSDADYVEFAAAVEHADKACNANADCDTYSPGLWCAASCWSYAIASSARAGLDAQRGTLDDTLCASLADLGCESPTMMTCPAIAQFPFGVGCVDGQCAALPEPAAQPETCEQIASGAFDFVPALEASGTCEQDDDCIVVEKGSTCVPSCDYFVTSEAAYTDFLPTLETQQQEVCASLTANECDVPYSGFICPPIIIPPPTPVCVNNLCVAE